MKLPRPSKHIWALLILGGLLSAFVLSGTDPSPRKKGPEWGLSSKVAEVLPALGAEKRLHHIDSIDPQKADRGEELVKKGHTTWPDGSKSPRVSKFFTCNDCHNLKREDPDLSVSDPEARLQYVRKKDMPFLQGTTLYGVVDRESYYNDDYVEKYGDKAVKARDTLRNAIQLCATECSQGRRLTEREMEAVLHYFHRLGIELQDIGFGIEQIEKLEKAAAKSGKDEKWIERIKGRYLSGSPATFLDALPTPQRGLGKNGDPKKGAFIYENSCQHCHMPGKGITRFTLDRSILTFKMLEKHLDDYSKNSIYQVIRYGTSPKIGYRPYMPHYTKERMSDGQIEDLAAYIRQKAKAP